MNAMEALREMLTDRLDEATKEHASYSLELVAAQNSDAPDEYVESIARDLRNAYFDKLGLQRAITWINGQIDTYDSVPWNAEMEVGYGEGGRPS